MNSSQTVTTLKPVLLLFIVKSNVCTLSQPETFVYVFVYTPVDVYATPSQINSSQAVTTLKPVLLLIVKSNVCTLSHPETFVYVFVYTPVDV